MDKPFSYFIDVSGSCNLRCPSCPVGNIDSKDKNRGLMSVDYFEKIIQKAIKETPNIEMVGLWRWTEPTLNPKLPQFLELLNKYGLKSMLSTNLNKGDYLYDIIKAGPGHIRVSLSGFYQQTYSKTHKKGNIELVKKNMFKLREIIDELKSKTTVDIFYHKYTHNMGDDFEQMFSLAFELGFNFVSQWAFYMPIESVLKYFEQKDNLPEKEKDIIDLLPVTLEQYKDIALRNIPADCLFRADMTNINGDGSVNLCSFVYKRENDISDNFLDISFEELQQRKYEHPLCKKCYEHGILGMFLYADQDEINRTGEKRLQVSEPYKAVLRRFLLSTGKSNF